MLSISLVGDISWDEGIGMVEVIINNEITTITPSSIRSWIYLYIRNESGYVNSSISRYREISAMTGLFTTLVMVGMEVDI